MFSNGFFFFKIVKSRDRFRNGLNEVQMMIYYLDKKKQHSGKRTKCLLPAFYPFTTMFSKVFLFKIVKTQDLCVVKVLQTAHEIELK